MVQSGRSPIDYATNVNICASIDVVDVPNAAPTSARLGELSSRAQSTLYFLSNAPRTPNAGVDGRRAPYGFHQHVLNHALTDATHTVSDHVLTTLTRPRRFFVVFRRLSSRRAARAWFRSLRSTHSTHSTRPARLNRDKRRVMTRRLSPSTRLKKMNRIRLVRSIERTSRIEY